MGRLPVLLCLVVLLSVGLAQGPRKPKPDDGKIVGGQDASISQYPYQVSIQTRGRQHFCGGSIITTRHVLTAAHCVDGQPNHDMRILAGQTELDDRGGQLRRVIKSTIHPSYKRENPDNNIAVVEPTKSNDVAGKINKWNKYRGKYFDNDIAVLELDEAFELDKDVQIIALDHQPFTPPDNLRVTGWGVTKENGRVSNHLQVVTVPGVNRKDCQRRYGRYNTITRNMVCAGYVGRGKGGKDACQGDSGGPAVSTKTKKQAGVVSWGQGCARAQFPGVYTNVANYIPWIRTVTRSRV